MKKYLFVNPFGIGDVVFTFYAVAALKKAQPGARVDFLCNERTIGLSRMNPDITRAFRFNRDEMRSLRTLSIGHFLAEYIDLVGIWKKERYDMMFDFSLGREFGFLGFLAGIPRRYGFDFKGRGFFLTHKTALEGYEGSPVAERQLDLLRRAGISVQSPAPIRWNVPDEDEKKAEAVLKDARVRRWMALAPGGGQSWGKNAAYKQWEPARFAEAANRWAESSGGVLLLGDLSEKKLLEEVRSRLRVPYAMACGESLGTAAALLKRCRLFLGNDGGLLHFAHSLGAHTVGVYGPVDEIAYGPFGGGSPAAVVTAEVPCRPCYQRFHFPACPYQKRCLNEISVQKVLESMDKIA